MEDNILRATTELHVFIVITAALMFKYLREAGGSSFLEHAEHERGLAFQPSKYNSYACVTSL